MKILFLLIISISLWANIGSIMAIKGSVDIKRENSSLSATNGMIILEGDEIVTQKKSRVQVMLKDDTVITIGSSSSFSFLEFMFDKSKKSKIAMKANRGFFRSVTGKIAKVAPERFKIVTVTATIGIRGTDFSGEILGDREIIKCYEGMIFVEFNGVTNDIDAGMMMEISQNKFNIRELDSTPSDTSTGDKKSLEVDENEENSISEDVIPEVTQITEDSDNYAEEEEHYQVLEPLEITTVTEDAREVKY